MKRSVKNTADRNGKILVACLLMLLLPLTIVGMLQTMAITNPMRDASGIEKPTPILGTISDVEITGLKPEAPASKPIFSGTLAPATEEPADLAKIIADLAYPAVDVPENLTAEQLDAISKLPPKTNKAGLCVHPALIPLFRDMVLNYTGGNYKNSPIHFRLHMPEPYEEGKKYPLVVWLHGIGECGSDNLDSLGHLHHIIPYLVGPKKRDFFLLVPQCPQTHRQWEAPEVCATKIRPDGSVECHLTDDPIALGNAPISFTIAFIEAMLKDNKTYPVDPNRITVTGLSSGGRGVWKFLERRPDLFAAAVPIVSWHALSKTSLREKPLLKKIPIWSIYSSDDNGIETSRKEFQRIKDAGCRASKTEFGVCGHRAWTPAMLQGDIFGWLISRAKDGERYYAATSAPTDPEKIGTFAEVTVGDLAKKKPTLAPAKTKQAVKPKAPTKAKQAEKLVVKPKKQSSKAKARTQKEIDEAFWKEKAKIAEALKRKRETISRDKSLFAQGVPESIKEIDLVRLLLIKRYLDADEVEKAIAVADKVKSNRFGLALVLLRAETEKGKIELLDYVDKLLDQVEQKAITQALFPQENSPLVARSRVKVITRTITKTPDKKPIKPIPAGKKDPMDECGKEWAMSTNTQYGLFPNGWEQEAKNIPDYVLKEDGDEIAARLANAFYRNEVNIVREICNSFIKLDDIPLSSPWFDTSGGRLKGRIKYSLNAKAKPVVDVLRGIVSGKNRFTKKAMKESAELAQKALDRIDAITNPELKK